MFHHECFGGPFDGYVTLGSVEPLQPKAGMALAHISGVTYYYVRADKEWRVTPNGKKTVPLRLATPKEAARFEDVAKVER